MLGFDGTIYSLNETAAQQVRDRLGSIEERVAILRRAGTLTDETLRAYYGEKRFEQVAESNAIEGSTLSIGETELAVLKGITITGHDPAYVRDAIALDRALTRMAEWAKDRSRPTDIFQLKEIHALLLGDRPEAGDFRTVRVSIRGSEHVPPKTWQAVMENMEQWERWSIANAQLPGLIRSAVMHAWLAHIHPFVDGNGRAARAIGNLELIRAGYPPIIIKRSERDRYIDALAESDIGGDTRSFLELVLDRVEGAVVGLEHSLRKKQGFDPNIERLRILQANQLRVWSTSVDLLSSILQHKITAAIDAVRGSCKVRLFRDALDLQGYLDLCNGIAVPRSWSFIIHVDIPGVPKLEKLAYYGHRSLKMLGHLNQQGGPALYWSSKNPNQFPKWLSDGPQSPFAQEITAVPGDGDHWIARRSDDSIVHLGTSELADHIVEAIIAQVGQ